MKVLIAPLDWGLGHATRCIPIIHALVDAGHEVVIASSGVQAQLLKDAFPQMRIIELFGYNVSYSKAAYLNLLKVAVQIPRLLSTIQAERNWLAQLLKQEHFDVVISDNRYGLSHPSVKSIFITHQLQVNTFLSFSDYLVRTQLYKYINQFHQCWVPDVENEQHSLGGKLSHPHTLPKIPTFYIGWLNRLEVPCVSTEKKHHVLCLLSGPEPQRSILEAKIIHQITPLTAYSFDIVRGLPDTHSTVQTAQHICLRNHCTATELAQLINKAQIVVCRGGYTSLMELIPFNKKLILVPTPQQTEQHYLAKRLEKKQLGIYTTQSTLCLTNDIERALMLPDQAFTLENNRINSSLLNKLLKAD